MFTSRRRLIITLVLAGAAMMSDVAMGQYAGLRGPTIRGGSAATLYASSGSSLDKPGIHELKREEARLAEPVLAGDGSGKFRTRQAVLLSGVAVSMLAYGYFALQFNNSRNDSEQAELAYEADVRENAQFYVDEMIPLDQIPTYYAWERAYTDAANARELISLAGISAFLLGLAAILDSATHSDNATSGAQARTVVPVLGVSPTSGDVILGARIGL